MPLGVQLSACIFCESTDISQEHLVADWALRGYARSKRPRLGSASYLSPELVVTTNEEPVVKAGVTCHACNQGWIRAIDTAASRILKPLIRADHAIVLSRAEQVAVATWVFKTALICHAARNGSVEDLSPLRQAFLSDKVPPPGCVIMVGPAPPFPNQLASFGLRPLNGLVRVQVVGADGRQVPVEVPIPGYLVMMGRLDGIIGHAEIPPVTAESLTGFTQVWPPSDRPVTVEARRNITAA